MNAPNAESANSAKTPKSAIVQSPRTTAKKTRILCSFALLTNDLTLETISQGLVQMRQGLKRLGLAYSILVLPASERVDNVFSEYA